jgi:putative sigma-54 modulation protein
MDVQIYHQDLELTDRLKDYVRAKVEKFTRYLSDIQSIRVDLKETQVRDVSERMVAQLTISVPQRLLRAEERAADIFTAFDAVMDKMDRQIERYRGRQLDRRSGNGLSVSEIAALREEELEEESSIEGKVVRVKEFEVGSLVPEAAVEQMELLGHYFFIFLDATDGRLSVVYKRRDGDYGVIKPIY